MEMFSSHVRSSLLRKKQKEIASQAEEGDSMDPTVTVGGKMMIDLHKSKKSVFVYLFSVILRIVVEGLFVYILLYWVLPKVSKNVYSCDAQEFENCSPVHQCVVRGIAEKQMSVHALLFISSLVIIYSGMFCLYSIGHYLC